jgi:hypothetical protein
MDGMTDCPSCAALRKNLSSIKKDCEVYVEQIGYLEGIKNDRNNELSALRQKIGRLRAVLTKITTAYAGCYPAEGEIVSPCVREAMEILTEPAAPSPPLSDKVSQRRKNR